MSATAVLISGQMRSFAQCYPTQRWQIFRHYEPDIHFFVSCVDDAQAHSAELLGKYGYAYDVEYYQDPTDLPEIPIEAGAHAPYANATTHKNLMLQHWGNKKVWEFSQKVKKHEFDTFIRIRPDQFIHRFIAPKFSNRVLAAYRNAVAYGASGNKTVFCPWWGKFGGVNDRLAVMGSESAPIYFNMYDDIQQFLKEGCPFHPETLVKESLIRHGADIKPLMAECSTQRMDGTRRWPEISASDLAELYYELSLK